MPLAGPDRDTVSANMQAADKLEDRETVGRVISAIKQDMRRALSFSGKAPVRMYSTGGSLQAGTYHWAKKVRLPWQGHSPQLHSATSL